MEYNESLEIYNKRLEGKTIDELCREYSISRGILSYYQNMYNFKVPKGNSLRKSVDKTYFDHINSEIKAYLLGFFIADGCIHKDNRLSLNLAIQDIDILTLYKQELKLEYDIKINKLSPSKLKMKNPSVICALRWRSPEHIKSLERLGICRGEKGKTYEDFNLPLIDISLIHHMIRGLTDGDGNWRCQERFEKGISRGYSIICSSEQFALDIKKYFTLNNIEVNIYKKFQTTMFTYSITCYKQKEIIKIYDLLYNNANYFFERKKKLAYYATLTPCKFRELKNSELCNA